MMFNIYFLSRRLLTSFILVAAEAHPYFQASSLLVLSTMSFIYLSVEKPMESLLANRIEIFNEACILLCCYVTFIQCNMSIKDEGKSFLGWFFIGTAGFNIFINVAATSFVSLIEIHG